MTKGRSNLSSVGKKRPKINFQRWSVSVRLRLLVAGGDDMTKNKTKSHHTQNITVASCTHIMHGRLQPGTYTNSSDTWLIRWNTNISYFIVLIWVRPVQNDCYPTTRERKHLYSLNSPLQPCTLHNVCFVKYDVTVSFLVQVLDTVTYFVSHVLESGCSDIFWHIF